MSGIELDALNRGMGYKYSFPGYGCEKPGIKSWRGRSMHGVSLCCVVSDYKLDA